MILTEESTRLLDDIGTQAVKFIRDANMARWPTALPSQMNIRRGVLYKSIGTRAGLDAFTLSLGIGSYGDIGSAAIGWAVQEMSRFAVRPKARRYMTVPLYSALDSRGVKRASSASVLKARLGVGFRVIPVGNRLFLGYYDRRKKDTVFLYVLRRVVPTKSAKILERTVDQVVVPKLQANRSVFSEARVFVRGSLVRRVEGTGKAVSARRPSSGGLSRRMVLIVKK